MSESKVSMKLLIDTNGKRVLFAEAGKECVDFLFNILSLPVATVIRLLREEGMVGSLPNLYKSMEDLDDDYIESGKRKDAYLKTVAPETYLKPVAPVSSSSAPLIALQDASPEIKSYRCSECSFSSFKQGFCHNCGCRTVSTAEEASGSESGGLVKGVVKYMVMDDLKINPMSTISILTLLKDSNVKEVAALEEKVVTLGIKEAVKLLKTSFQSKNVLTQLFC